MCFIKSERLKSFCLSGIMPFLSVIIIAILFPASADADREVFSACPFHKGETIEYDIKKFGIKVGEARIVFKGKDQINSREAVLIVFTSHAPRFYDEERIYLDPDTYYPIVVKRNLDIFGKKEVILEDYSPTEGMVRIIKQAGGKKTEQVIKKDKALDNIYGFIYRYRKEGRFKVGDTLKVYLPTKDIDINLVKQDRIKIAGKGYDTYFMQSIPAQYKIWFDSQADRIPLRIDGSVGLSKTSMVLRRYIK